jgi:hypothetical protein
VLFGFVARHGLRRRERWAHISLSASLGTWFVLDSVASVMIGATFNVLHVNLPCLLVLGIPLLLLRCSAEAGVTGTDRRNEESTPGDRTRDREGPS